MSKAWRVISIIVMIVILLGAVCIGVGLVTGGEWARVYDALDESYSVKWYVENRQQYLEYPGKVIEAIRTAWITPSV